MFIISEKQLRDFDLTNAKQFVQYWGKPYSYASVKDYNTKKNIDYIEELNLGEGIGVRLHKFTKCKIKIEEENVKL